MLDLLAEPLPVDAVRDAWDWTGFVVTLLGAAVGAIALVYAGKATREAAAARRSVAHERRRTFELEVLRELLGLTDDLEFIADVVINRHVYRPRVGGRLAVLPVDDLATWRRFAGDEEVMDILDPTPEERAAIREPNWRERDQHRTLRRLIKAALTTDVREAIERRMAERD